MQPSEINRARRVDPSTIDGTIAELSKTAKDYVIAEKNLAKFGDAEMDKICLSYVHSKDEAYVKFLAALVKKLDLKNVVELGNREGLSTLAIYDALPQDGAFMTIDIEKDQRYCPDEMWTDKRVDFVFGDVSDIDIIKKVPMDIELLFSDTIHYNFQIQDEFDVYQHLLADTALVAIDDTRVNDKGIFWDKVTYRKWDLSEVCHHNGWGVFLFERKEPMTADARKAAAAEASARIWKRKFDESQSELATTLGKKMKRAKARIADELRKRPKVHKASIAIRKKLGLIK